jgi:DNA-nicking Smr family endonuclease
MAAPTRQQLDDLRRALQGAQRRANGVPSGIPPQGVEGTPHPPKRAAKRQEPGPPLRAQLPGPGNTAGTATPQPPRAATRPPISRPRAVLQAASLQDLGAIRQHMHAVREQAAAQELARKEAEARAEAARNLFARAVGAVRRLPDRNLAELPADQPPPIPVQHQLDEQRVLQESISDDFDVSTLLDTDDALSFRRPGLGLDVTRKLRSGTWSIQRQLDLHGMRTDEAREALGRFIREAHRQGIRCVRVVHGKGLGSPGRSPVLKSRVQSWLVQKSQVLAFVQARPLEGGAGALVVLLQPSPGAPPGGS